MAKYEVKDINKNGKIDGWEQAKYDAINKSADSPATMISTAMTGVDPMTGMVQQNQFAPSTMNPTALGGLQNQIPNLVGQSVPGSFDRVLPQGMYANAQEAITAKTNSRMAQALGGALSPFSQSTHGMLSAKTSKQAAEAERKRKEAQKKAKEAQEKTKTSNPPRNLYKDVDGVVRDKDGKDAGYPTINESYTSREVIIK